MVFEYDVTYLNEDSNKEIYEDRSKGLVFARSYVEAVKELVEAYGEEETTSMNLRWVEDGNVISYQDLGIDLPEEESSELGPQIKEALQAAIEESV